uniref:Uncharacterized protein n=1 Tax=Tabanus bromius TaxID=304241 RepID=A0A0K8TQZ9_TABBR
MDILKKIFSKTGSEKGSSNLKDEFRKPSWFEEIETDDELFDNDRSFIFQIFTNPIELQKHFDQQMQEILKSFKQEEEDDGDFFNQSPRDEYLKPGFEGNLIKEFKRHKSLDTDLDGEIYPDQLHTLLQRLSPEIQSILPENSKKGKNFTKQIKEKLSEEDLIMGRIHGTILDESQKPAMKRKDVYVPKMSPHFGGVFEGTYQGPKMFGQSVMTQTIRKPDGTCETKRIIRDTDGNVKTTITRTIDGKTETVTTYGNGQNEKTKIEGSMLKKQDDIKNCVLPSDRNVYVSKAGYALPKNLW